MKKILIAIICVCIFKVAFAQENKSLPQVNLENLKGNVVSSLNILNTEGPTIISFWATWCKPCIMELNEIQDLYSDWKDETNVKIIAVSVDDARSSSKVPSFVNGKSWDFDIYLDTNSQFKRALNISNVPYTLLLNSKGEIVWQHSGYTPGDEEILFEKLVDLKGK